MLDRFRDSYRPELCESSICPPKRWRRRKLSQSLLTLVDPDNNPIVIAGFGQGVIDAQ